MAGVAEGCVQSNAALVGGGTAEMPGMYGEDDYDLAGFAVGVAEKSQIITGEKISEGDILIGLASSGIHSNGFSLVRKVFENTDLNGQMIELGGQKLIDNLLTPTKIYVKDLMPLVKAGVINGISHITGGGFIENIPRMFGDDLAAEITEGTWDILPIFDLLEKTGKLKHSEMFEIFNMGLGMVLAISPENLEQAKALLEGNCFEIGQIVKRDTAAVIIK